MQEALEKRIQGWEALLPGRENAGRNSSEEPREGFSVEASRCRVDGIGLPCEIVTASLAET